MRAARLPATLDRLAQRAEGGFEMLVGRLRPSEPAAWPGPATTLPPVFVGGSGRSGTTITGRLLGAHAAYRVLGIEIRFISDPFGLVHLAEGRTSLRRFRTRLLGHWFARREIYGLQRLFERRDIEARLPELGRRLASDRWLAGRAFAHDLLDPFAIAAGAQGWVEQSPTNARVAPGLLRMFPGARVIHIVRDGRDVACSLVKQPWGPKALHPALDWWARRYRWSAEACAAAPADQTLTVRMENLMVLDREATLARMLAFVGLDEDDAIRSYFDGTATADRAHVGRWQEDVPAAELAAFEAHYDTLVADLDRRGLALPPLA